MEALDDTFFYSQQHNAAALNTTESMVLLARKLHHVAHQRILAGDDFPHLTTPGLVFTLL